MLFDGHCNFGKDLYPSLEQILPTKSSRSAALEFPAMRNNQQLLERSELERACGAQGKTHSHILI